MSLTQQAFSGVLWTALERFGVLAIQFGVLVVLARLLSPEDFGLVAMLMVVFSVSSVLVNGGFTEALIREPEILEEDKATAFWLNLIASAILFGVLWATAPVVAAFFDQPELVGLTRFMALHLLFLALSLVQQAVLTHQLSFKVLGVVSLTAASISGGVAIYLAYGGSGVWALAAQYVLTSACTSVGLWIANPWKPTHGINRRSVEKLFGFGLSLTLSGLLNRIYDNVYKIVIGKFFTVAVLGFYTQAQNFQRVASQGMSGVLQKVTYPLLSKANDDPVRLKRGYRKVIQVSSYIIFPLMVGMALSAEPLVLTLIGEKWLQAVPFLQILCVSGALYHLHSINLNVLKVVGRSDLFLKLEVVKKIVITIAVAIGLQFGIWGLLVGQVVSSYISLFINMYYTRYLIDYPIGEQMVDIAKVLVLSVPMAFAVWSVQSVGTYGSHAQLVIMVGLGALVYGATGLLSNAAPVRTIKEMVASKRPVLSN